MVNLIDKKLRALWSWFRSHAHGAHARFWLALAAFIESWFYFIPPDVFLAAIIAAGNKRWILYASITTVASVFGAFFGYIIGAFFFESIGAQIVQVINEEALFHSAQQIFDEQAFWIIFVTAITPIPFVPFVLASGFFSVNLGVFLLAAVLGRGLRYFTVAYLVHAFGEVALETTNKYSKIITVAVLVIALVFGLLKLGVV